MFKCIHIYEANGSVWKTWPFTYLHDSNNTTQNALLGSLGWWFTWPPAALSSRAFLSTNSCPVFFNPFSQFDHQLEIYFQLQLSLGSDPIAFSVPKSTCWVLVKIQGEGMLKPQWKSDANLSIFWTKWKLMLKTSNGFFR